jgi:hypothetical protein
VVFDATGQEGEGVEGGLVRPVHVLDDDDGRRRADLLEQLVEDGVGAARGEGRAQVRTRGVGEVAEGSHRPRGDEVVARPGKDTGRPVRQ